MAGLQGHPSSHLPSQCSVLCFPQANLEVKLSWSPVFSKSDSPDLAYDFKLSRKLLSPIDAWILCPDTVLWVPWACRCNSDVQPHLRTFAQRLAVSRLGSGPLVFVLWEYILPIRWSHHVQPMAQGSSPMVGEWKGGCRQWLLCFTSLFPLSKIRKEGSFTLLPFLSPTPFTSYILSSFHHYLL